jgi:cation diffusion facilitator family transporter
MNSGHSHVFLGAKHTANERKAWTVIGLCTVMMVLEIGGGWLFGSLALIADGLHMSTHVVALLIAALAYTFARRYANDSRFTFGTGKLGDLAGFTSAIILAMIALLIGYEALSRFFEPVHIRFDQAIPIASLGLLVNIASAWLLSGDHNHDHAHGDRHDHGDHHAHDHDHDHDHAPKAQGAHHRDHNLRAAFVHVLGDAAVSVLAILALLSGRFWGWVWMDPVMGLVGAVVIAAWAVTLVRDTGRILLDFAQETSTAEKIRGLVEEQGDEVVDLHLWRLGPGHLGAILSVNTVQAHDVPYYRSRLKSFAGLSHVTIEVVTASRSDEKAIKTII